MPRTSQLTREEWLELFNTHPRRNGGDDNCYKRLFLRNSITAIPVKIAMPTANGTKVQALTVPPDLFQYAPSDEGDDYKRFFL